MRVYSNAEEALKAEGKKPKPVDSLIAKNFGAEKSIEQLLSKKLKRAERKDKLIPKDRRCPRCKNVKSERQRWVLQKGVCRACFKVTELIAFDPTKLCELKIETQDIRYAIMEFDVGFLQGSPTMMARILGEDYWTPTRIFNIQHRRILTVSLKEKLFLELHWPEFVFKEDRRRLRIKNNYLRRLRDMIGISQRDLARNCGWTRKKIENIEIGRQYVTSEDLVTIKEAINRLCE